MGMTKQCFHCGATAVVSEEELLPPGWRGPGRQGFLCADCSETLRVAVEAFCKVLKS